MNSVHTDIHLSISRDVESGCESMGLLEAAYQFDVSSIAGVVLKLIDNRGMEHEVTVHDWKTDLSAMKFIAEA